MIFYQKQYDALYTYHSDAQGNIVAISAEDGTILEKYAYDVYGRLTGAGIWNSGTQQYDAVTTSGGFVDMDAYYAASLIGNEIFFQGRRYDRESGLYYFRNRYYDPETGRFISRDPSGPVDGPNLYAFVNNNPINYVDPLGLLASPTPEEQAEMDKQASLHDYTCVLPDLTRYGLTVPDFVFLSESECDDNNNVNFRNENYDTDRYPYAYPVMKMPPLTLADLEESREYLPLVELSPTLFLKSINLYVVDCGKNKVSALEKMVSDAEGVASGACDDDAIIIRATKLSDLKDAIKSVIEEGGCVGSIRFFGHGYSGGMYVGSGKGLSLNETSLVTVDLKYFARFDDPAFAAKYGSDMAAYFAVNAEIFYYGCNVGYDMWGRDFMRETANRLLHINGGSVFAGEGNLVAGGDFLGLCIYERYLYHSSVVSYIYGYDDDKTLNGDSVQFLKVSVPFFRGRIPLELDGASRYSNIRGLGDITPK